MAKTSHGYERIWLIGCKGKTQYEHILVMEQLIGKPIPKNWVVHHIDGNGRNNQLSNLILCPRSTHFWLHHRERAERETGSRDSCWCSWCKSWKDKSEMVASRYSGHCKSCHARRNRESGRVRDYKAEWAKQVERNKRKEKANS